MSRRLRHLVEFAGYWAVTRAVRLLPHRWSLALGSGLGRLGYLLLPSRRRLTLANMRRLLSDRAERSRRRIARASFAHWGETFVESISLARYAPAELAARFEVEGLERLAEARADGRGMILLSGHFGSFELASYFVGPHLGRLHILVRQQSNPWVDRDTSRLRQRTGHVLVPRRGSGPRLLAELRRGGAIGLAIDQRVPVAEGILLPFLGEPAWTSTIPAFLSTVTGAPAVPMLAEPAGRGRHRIRFEPPVRPAGRGPVEVARLTRRYLAGLESAIRERPDRWLWMHRRWQRSGWAYWPELVERLRRESGLPPPAEIAELGHGMEIGGDVAALERSIDRGFVERGDWLVIDGGDPRRRRAVTLAVAGNLADRGCPVLLRSAAELGGELAAAAADARLTLLQRLDRIDLLVLEGLEAVAEGAAATALEELLERRGGVRSLLAPLAAPPAVLAAPAVAALRAAVRYSLSPG